MNETWIHHYIPESNRSSAEWREAGESSSKRVKASRWAVFPMTGSTNCCFTRSLFTVETQHSNDDKTQLQHSVGDSGDKRLF
ncbi:hypothetical protein ACLKA7_001427 [Drosophila subpalustris]